MKNGGLLEVSYSWALDILTAVSLFVWLHPLVEDHGLRIMIPHTCTFHANQESAASVRRRVQQLRLRGTCIQAALLVESHRDVHELKYLPVHK